jgi:hypothetical protein
MYTHELLSYFISDSVNYSDGKHETSSFLPSNDKIGICFKCKKAFWKEDSLMENQFMEGNYPNNLTITDLEIAIGENSNYKIAIWYSDLLKNEFAKTKEKEIYLRFKIWHILNDNLRTHNKNFFYYLKGVDLKKAINVLLQKHRNKKLPNKSQKLFIENLERLIEIFEITNDDDKLLIAEMHRESGNFLEASQLLKEIKTENKNRIYRQIKQANKIKKSLVINVNKFN